MIAYSKETVDWIKSVNGVAHDAKYVILDDMSHTQFRDAILFGCKFVKTNPSIGLQDSHVDEIVEYFKGA